MRQKKIALFLSVLMLASLACNAVTRLASPENILPAVLTAAPTALEEIATSAAEVTPPSAEATPTAAAPKTPSAGEKSPASGLGVSLKSVRPILEGTQQFTFKDGTIGGQPAVIASFSASAATSMPGISTDFSAAFIGNQDDLGQIRITTPYTEDQASVDAGMGMLTVIFASFLPPDTLFTFLPWITDNYSKLPDGGSAEMTSKNMKFTLTRLNSIMQLDIVPAQ